MANAHVIEKRCSKHRSYDCISCFYEILERAAIMEVDGKLKRQQAERLAIKESKKCGN